MRARPRPRPPRPRALVGGAGIGLCSTPSSIGGGATDGGLGGICSAAVPASPAGAAVRACKAAIRSMAVGAFAARACRAAIRSTADGAPCDDPPSTPSPERAADDREPRAKAALACIALARRSLAWLGGGGGGADRWFSGFSSTLSRSPKDPPPGGAPKTAGATGAARCVEASRLKLTGASRSSSHGPTGGTSSESWTAATLPASAL
mmetsp:Transcript_24201/g.71776  ORF Transcript_24201/g.71776 Transcript_24201/m.71776 type:complete len:207 (+) Transcript_24201:360-980(+)